MNIFKIMVLGKKFYDLKRILDKKILKMKMLDE